uniref:Lactamase_B domain-containing protein n=1 Tax=Rhabditophanes sp. KR3021 TaxID=114890 RepID=A0AC35U8W3_9BILA
MPFRRLMDIVNIKQLSDNYAYLLICKATRKAAVIDPISYDDIEDAVRVHNVKSLEGVLVTHHHLDHSAGAPHFAEPNAKLRTQIYGGDKRIQSVSKLVKDGDKFKIGNIEIECLFTPCHTTGHICYHAKASNNEGAVFTGDTLFIGGCGRFFEGTAEQMHYALNSVLAYLPDHTSVYCGHEYTEENLKFALTVDKDNEVLKKKLNWAIEMRKQGRHTTPSTIGDEKTFNPFMRVNDSGLQKTIGFIDPIDVMQKLREMKNNYRSSL